MASKKPLVITDGQIEQLQAGDTLDASVTEVDVVDLENQSGGSAVIGTPIYISGGGQFDLAQANAQATVQVAGLVRATSISDTQTGSVQTDGVLVATTTQWDAVTGGSGGLTPDAVYWLDPDTAGMLTDTAPTDAGDFVVRVGLAHSTTELDITIEPPIKL